MHPWSAALRRARRSLLATPLLTIAALACLALGLGAVTAIFSALDAALLRPLPYRDPGRLVTIFRTTPNFDTGPFAPSNFLDLRDGLRTLEPLAAVAPGLALLQDDGDPLRVTVHRGSGNLFRLLGVRPVRGRLLEPDDERDDRPEVTLVTEEIWRDRYGADPGLVGRTVRLGGRPVTVIGVLPRGFKIQSGVQNLRADFWTQFRLSPNDRAQRRNNYIWLFGRLVPGASVVAADRELRTRMAGLIRAHPELTGESIRAVGFHEEAVRPIRGPLLLLFGAVFLVLLIAAANVTSLLLARGAERQREVAVRIALGASRRDILREVLTESAVLATMGIALGLSLAFAGVRLIGKLAAVRLPQLDGLSIDWRVGGFAILLAAIVGLASGTVPGWRASGVDPEQALRPAGTRIGAARGEQRFLRGLIAGEVALALVLVLGAALVLRGFRTLLERNPGFEPDRLLTMVVDVSAERYPARGDAVRRFVEPAIERIRGLPGVTDAGVISIVPYDNWGNNSNVAYEGRPAEDPTRLPLVENRLATPGLFRTFGQRLIAGRLLDDAVETSDSAPPAVVANEALARRDFPGVDPVGKRFRVDDSTWGTIVGVVSDIRNAGPFLDPRPEMYWSYRQAGGGATGFPLVVRVRSGDPTAVAGLVTEALREVDPTVAVSRVRPMAAVIERSVGQPRFYLLLLGAFAAVALLLAAAGLYGLTSFAVARRTREIGIRAALGATPASGIALLLRDAGGLVAIGLATGLPIAFLASRLLRGLLYGADPLDPVVWAAVAGLLAATGFLAALVPARRAARVAPLIAIRGD